MLKKIGLIAGQGKGFLEAGSSAECEKIREHESSRKTNYPLPVDGSVRENRIAAQLLCELTSEVKRVLRQTFRTVLLDAPNATQ